MKTILAIDGGGVRGIIPTRLLAALQQRLPAPLADYFDLIGGTSSGAISALSLARPDPVAPGALTAEFQAMAPKMFSASWQHRLTHLDGLIGPRYSADPLEALFRRSFGTLRLSDLRCPVVVPALDVLARRAKLFCRPKDEVSKEQVTGACDYVLADVLRATTAAPTYFRPAELIDDMGQRQVFIDGGLFANNPSMYALASVDRSGWFLRRNPATLLVSLGTGLPTRRFPTLQARDWGTLQWISPVIELMGTGLDNAIDYAVQQGFEADHYHRFQIDLARRDGDTAAPKDELDNASPGNMALLIEWGNRLAVERAEELDQIATMLIKSGTKR